MQLIIYQLTYLPTYLPTYRTQLSIYPSMYLATVPTYLPLPSYLLVYLNTITYLPIHLRTIAYIPTCLSTYLLAYLSSYLPTYLPIIIYLIRYLFGGSGLHGDSTHVSDHFRAPCQALGTHRLVVENPLQMSFPFKPPSIGISLCDL